jgi:rubrerythrin
MNKWNSINEAIDYAIEQEEEAAAFYSALAEKTADASSKSILEGFAKEEEGHKAKLEAVKAGVIPRTANAKVADLKIGDYLVDVEASPDMDYQDALIVAMKKEKAAFRLYSDLANLTDDPQLRSTFLFLAQEEAKHKLRFEIEYDENVLVEN